MCFGCGKYTQGAQVVLAAAQPGYREGQDGYVDIQYTGTGGIKAAGKYTGTWYYFMAGRIRTIDKNDAVALAELPQFELVQAIVRKEEPVVENEVVKGGADATSDIATTE